MNTYAQKEIIGVVKIVKTVTNMEVSLTHDSDLQSQNLIEALQVARTRIDEVVAHAEVDGEIGHDKLYSA